MVKLIDRIEKKLKEAFESCGYDKKFGAVNISNRPDLCQYQCNGALAAAKLYKKPPIEIANELVSKIDNDDMFYRVCAVMPGFINITLKPSYLAGYLTEMAKDTRLLLSEAEDKHTIIIDYGGANVAKPLHVGHLRSAIIGESIKRLKRHMGHKVIGDVHLGDWGLPIGLIIEQLRDDQPDLIYFDDTFSGEYPEKAPFTIEELEQIYPAASARAKIEDAFKARAEETTLLLQKGKLGFQALWKHIINISVMDLKKNYGNLNVDFDLWKGESDAEPYINTLIEDLINRGYAYESQGAIVVDVKEETDTKEIPPCIIRKSNGAALYATSDIGTMIEREKLYQPDEYIYMTDKRQEMNFTQVFRTVKKTGLVRPEVRLIFLGFGTMNGKDGKPFKTRDGGVMRLEMLIQAVEDAVYEKIMSNRTMEEDQAKEIAKIVGLAALKYGDLSNQSAKDYIFDIERFTSFEGDTGPYILYTIVRIKSILAKYSELMCGDLSSISMNDSSEPADSEIELMLQIAKYNDVIEHAAEENAPHKVCQYIFDLANIFNSFYHENKIIAEVNKERQSKWIAIITLALRILEVCIDLLGFEAPEKM